MDPFFPPPGILKAPQGAQITKVAVKLELGGGGSKGDPQFVELDHKRPLAAVVQVCNGALHGCIYPLAM